MGRAVKGKEQLAAKAPFKSTSPPNVRESLTAGLVGMNPESAHHKSGQSVCVFPELVLVLARRTVNLIIKPIIYSSLNNVSVCRVWHQRPQK